jgi:hypothetical protein
MRRERWHIFVTTPQALPWGDLDNPAMGVCAVRADESTGVKDLRATISKQRLEHIQRIRLLGRLVLPLHDAG